MASEEAETACGRRELVAATAATIEEAVDEAEVVVVAMDEAAVAVVADRAGRALEEEEANTLLPTITIEMLRKHSLYFVV